MNAQEIENIELTYLETEDYKELKAAMIASYKTMPGTYWKEEQIDSLLSKFREGQVVIKVNGQLAGCALSILSITIPLLSTILTRTLREISPSAHTPMTVTCSTESMFLSSQNSADFDSGADCTTTEKNCAKN